MINYYEEVVNTYLFACFLNFEHIRLFRLAYWSIDGFFLSIIDNTICESWKVGSVFQSSKRCIAVTWCFQFPEFYFCRRILIVLKKTQIFYILNFQDMHIQNGTQHFCSLKLLYQLIIIVVVIRIRLLHFYTDKTKPLNRRW